MDLLIIDMKVFYNISYFICLVLFFYSCGERIQSPSINNTSSASMTLNKAEIIAGESCMVKIEIENPSSNKYRLLIHSFFNQQQLELTLEKGLNEIKLDKLNFTKSGHYNFYLYSEIQLVSTTSLQVLADAVVDDIEVFTGPNTIWHNGQQESMVSTIAMDKFGNALSEPIDIKYNIRFPDNILKTQVDHNANMCSSIVLKGGRKIGKVLIGIETWKIGAGEQEIEIISKCPTKIKLRIVEHFKSADSRQFLHLKTNILTDEVGNIIPNGTAVYFNIKDNLDQNYKYQALTIDGVANVYIQNPSKASTWNIRAQVCNNVLSKVLKLKFNGIASDFKLKQRMNKVLVGPIRAQSGQFIADGTPVNYSFLKNQEELKFEAQIIEGAYQLDLNKLGLKKGSHRITFEVIGIKKFIEVQIYE